MIQNPILPGFHPDPSICRVGDDYYIATSTFEWYPGVQIYHSRDLRTWNLVNRPLDRAEQLDLRGVQDSCGVWAPCLTHADGRFWLIYTDMKRRSGSFKDCHNYLVTSNTITGPWSAPIYLNSSGFDPSLFHDENGRKWLVNLTWDYRRRPSAFGGIVLQEYDHGQGKLVGPVTNIFRGSAHGLAEGPHLYQRDGWYHLLVAEGGTGMRHAVTMARARDLTGPYELHPDTHVVTSRFHPDATLQRAGHGDIVETPAGETYMVHLCSRPLPGIRRSVLGRETAIQKCKWGDDGWLRLEGKPLLPQERIPMPKGVDAADPTARTKRYTFASTAGLPADFQWLRTPYPERLFSLQARPGHLRLTGREAIGSSFEQSLVARRQTDFDFDAETEVDAKPTSYHQMAGLVAYYSSFSYHYLCLTHDETAGRVLQILSCAGGWPKGMADVVLEEPVSVPDGPVRMKLEVRGAAGRFYFWKDDDWARIGPVLDHSVLSDEGGEGEHANFTGAFVGMSANDTSGQAMAADFSCFIYRVKEEQGI
ncbi:xylan 1,4-beta-xylosidase [Neorhizobium huautlense]|uniref:Xylan 1,4-beta-xylosidase n=1 Tax=Neorhizobium huautlense TaxID=67774 RepID=A0ABT9PPZ4_9HYPH|nr:glycoside hydrolase family 43 protein [Neorhizobium huautlense]MDP9836256.1 xylan 1,4-beta-xylosidase [Neorhizobium huautlense]